MENKKKNNTHIVRAKKKEEVIEPQIRNKETKRDREGKKYTQSRTKDSHTQTHIHVHLLPFNFQFHI